MTDLDKICHKLMDSNHELKAKCALLEQENEELKSELQRVYNVATLKKARDIVNIIYDDLLYETSEESDYARNKVLECLKRLDEFGDNLE